MNDSNDPARPATTAGETAPIPYTSRVPCLVDLTQYMRLAGLFSFFGYIAGNDPTVFSSLLSLGSSRLRTQPQDTPGKR